MLTALEFSGRRRTPVVLQTEAAECGLACLAMVAGSYGHEIDLAVLRQKHSVSLKGASLAQVMQTAAALNLTPRPLKVPLDHLRELRLPALLHWDFNHFVVLVARKPNAAVIHDPAQGVLTVGHDELSKRFTGVALELVPSEQFELKTERRRVSLPRLIGALPGSGGLMAHVLLLAAAIEVFAVASPFYMQWVVDHALVSEDRPLLTVLGVGFLLLALIQVGVSAARSWAVLYLGMHLNLHMVTRLFRHLLRLPMAFFERRHLGDVVSRFESLNAIQRTLTTSFIEAVLDGVMALVTLLVLFVYSWKLTLVVIVAAGLYGGLRLASYRPLRAANEAQIVKAAKQQTHFLETVRGVQSIKLFGRQLLRQTRFQNLAVDHINASIRVNRLKIWFQAGNSALFGIENVAVVWIGASLVLSGGFSVGMLFAFLAYKQQFVGRITGLVDKYIDFRMLGLHAERVADVALSEPEPECAPGATRSPEDASLEVRNLSVRYADSEPFVLRKVSLRVEPGESVAIIGPSGCGKTTLIKAMLGLLPAAEGEILVGGAPLERLGPDQYRAMIGTVMQDDQLFGGSIGENICFFDAQPDQARIEECARLAAVHDDIAAMPMGYNTLIGDMGTVLSGGQKQRVLLARALYKNPRILFLDEATSHLDVVRERRVSEAIRALELTRVIVAHRRETIATVDRVILLGPGTTQSLSVEEMMAQAA